MSRDSNTNHPALSRYAPREDRSQSEESAALRLAQQIRDYSRSVPAGTFLGSQGDMMKRFGASRQTLRAASALLIRDGLISTRRGIGGGYFADDPDGTAVYHSVASFLNMSEISIRQLAEAVMAVRTEIVRRAAIRGTASDRRRLGMLLAQDDVIDFEDVHAMLGHEREYRELFSTMAGNPVLQLLSQVVSDLIRRGDAGLDIFDQHPDHIREYLRERVKMAQAVIDGDSEIAVTYANRLSDMTFSWLDEDDGQPSSTGGFSARLSSSLKALS